MDEFMEYFFLYLSQFAFLIFIGLFALYIVLGLALTTMTNKLGEKGSWMSWVPILNLYLIGKLGFDSKIGLSIIALFVMCCNFTLVIDGVTYMNGTLVTEPFKSIGILALIILLLASLYKIYDSFSTESVTMTLFTFLSCGILAPIFLLQICKNEPRRVIHN